MNINWFPGHMFKTQKEIKSMINLVDLIIEIRDARAVIATTNPDIENLTRGKPRIIVLSKIDLADSNVTNEWIKFYENSDINCVSLNIVRNKNIKDINFMINRILGDKIKRYELKGVKNYTLRGIILGIPNVGKSSLINRICNSSVARVGNKPGVTKSKQWIKTKWGIDLLDTPGILWPKFSSEDVALNLSYIGSIKDEILDIQELAYRLTEFLSLNYRKNLESVYNLVVSDDVSENFDNIGIRLGCIKKGSTIDYDRLSKMILTDFRSGKLGNISLETPQDFERVQRNEI